MKYILIFIFTILLFKTKAQIDKNYLWDKNVVEREFLPYQSVREADIFWSKRIWRIIDTREKQNLIFIYPQMPLFKIIHSSVLEGAIQAYDNTVINGDQFKKTLSLTAVKNIGVVDDTISTMDPISLEVVNLPIHEELDFSKIKRFKIKEEWFFNSATSTMEVRIIGLAPLMEVFDDDDIYLGDETLYWIYYKDLRPILAKYEAYNPGNNAVRLSWDDVFEARYFASYIYKEDNVYDRAIQEYATREEALYESERIKKLIFNFEHDLWYY